MSMFDPFSPEFEDYPWDPTDPYAGGPGDLFDPADLPAESAAPAETERTPDR